MSSLVVALLFISGLALLQPAVSQDVEIRATGEKVNPISGTRTTTIYSQRHLSPHRMMHFGKRPDNQEAPLILAPQLYDIFPPPVVELAAPLEAAGPLQPQQAQQQQQQQQQLLLEQVDSRYPYLISFEVNRGRGASLRVPAASDDDEASSLAASLLPVGSPLYTIDRPHYDLLRAPQFGRLGQVQQQPQQQQRQQQRQQPEDQQLIMPSDGRQKFLKLVSSESNKDDQAARSNQQEEADDSRSVLAKRPFNKPNSFISTLLFGRQSSSAPTFGVFNKKAEPKDNFFMHFGRK